MSAKPTPALRALIVALVAVALGAVLIQLTRSEDGDRNARPTTQVLADGSTATSLEPSTSEPSTSGSSSEPASSASGPSSESAASTPVSPTSTPDTAAPAQSAAAPTESSPASGPTAASSAAAPAISAAPLPDEQPGDVPAVDAQAYVVFDAASQKVIAAKNADERRSVASLMKLLNAQVVLEAGDLEQPVKVPAMNTDMKESQIGLRTGETWSRAVLLRAMIIVSANDAARALAHGISGSESAFVEAMNATAQRLGLTDTVARNASGLDAAGQHSSANDMLTLSRMLMADDVFRAAAQRRSARLHGNTYPATNKLLGTYAGADGVKTGHTTEAGYCFAASATRDGRQIFVVVLGSSSVASRDAAVTALFDWAFARG